MCVVGRDNIKAEAINKVHFSDQSSLEWAGIWDVWGGGGDKAGEAGRGPIMEVFRYHAVEDGLYLKHWGGTERFS